MFVRVWTLGGVVVLWIDVGHVNMSEFWDDGGSLWLLTLAVFNLVGFFGICLVSRC